MASPYSSGGGGTHFEARVVAYYLAALLAEAPARGVPGLHVTEVLTQRADFGDPLDDLTVTGAFSDGSCARLAMQVKSSLSFTEKDKEWVSVLEQAWDTFKGTFDDSRDRIAVAISSYNARADKHYQAVLKWAAHSATGAHFFERIAKKDFAHKDMRDFVSATRNILSNYSKAAVDEDTLWRFLRAFQIIHFDFATEESSRDGESAEDRLRNHLPLDQRGRAAELWTHLIENAGRLIPVGGGATRASLIVQLQTEDKPAGTAASLWKDLEAIDRESKRALTTIKADIHGLRIYRPGLIDTINEALTSGRFIQLDGEPGSGKSALLREVAEGSARSGPIFVLKDIRIQPRGWAAQATALAVTGDLVALLVELGTTSEPILFIDGIDKITDAAVQLTVNDVVTAIATSPELSRWKILTTVR
jgi:hypothetical protein